MSTLTSHPHSLPLGRTEPLGQSETISRHELHGDSDDHVLRVDGGASSNGSMKQESALAVLASNSVAELRFLRVDEDADEIHLSGRVRTFYHKQLAQEAMRPIADGRRVINRVTVNS